MLATNLPPEDLGFLRELALVGLPANNEQDRIRYCEGVVKGALLQALAREKVDLLAALKRIDAQENAQQYSQVQKELVELELERRRLM